MGTASSSAAPWCRRAKSERARRAFLVELVAARFEHVIHVVVGEAQAGRVEMLGILHAGMARAVQHLVGYLRGQDGAAIGHLAGEDALGELVLLPHHAADTLGIARIVDAV